MTTTTVARAVAHAVDAVRVRGGDDTAVRAFTGTHVTSPEGRFSAGPARPAPAGPP